MKNIYVDTGELSGTLLNRTIEKMEVAKKKMGYNYSADAYLEVAISMAKYDSPAGRQQLFNINIAETAGILCGKIEDVLKKLFDFKTILLNCPDELCEVDEKQKGEISNFCQRTSYYLSDPVNFFATVFGFGNLGSEFILPEFTDTNRKEILGRYCWDGVLVTEEELNRIAAECNSESELVDRINQLMNSDRNLKALMEKTIQEDLGVNGDKYWDWYYGEDRNRIDSYCALFAAYHIAHAGIDMETPTQNYDIWVKTYPSAQMGYFQQQGSFHPKGSNYVPKTGDVLFVDWDGGSSPKHVGMIYIGDDGQTYVLHGNNDAGQVALTPYSKYWAGVTVGFGSTQELYASQQIQ